MKNATIIGAANLPADNGTIVCPPYVSAPLGMANN